MVGILAEKPSQARNFAKALGGMTGTYNGESYVIVPARGHLYEFSDPSKQVPASLAKTYSSWTLDALPWDESIFAWKREKKKDTAQTLKTIRDTFSKCSEVVIGTDDDPTGEGELIAWEILSELALRPAKVSRMYFTDESEKEVRKAFTNRKHIPSMTADMDYVKALYRTQWDFMSMQFTRIATLSVGANNVILRQGRLKSAIVKLVGDQLELIKAYKPVPFYTNKFKDENGHIYVSVDEPSYDSKDKVPIIYKTSAVIIDSKSMAKTAPPKLIDLASLSAKLSSKGIKADTVLKTYQKMYEAQVVSYPRTEDKFITPEQFNDLLPHVDKIAKLVGVDTNLLSHRSPRATHVKTGCAHGANRPGPKVPTNLDSLDGLYGAGAKDIYIILAKNYLSMLAEDYVYERQLGHLEKYPAFKGSANIPMSQGWRAVQYDAEDDDMSSDVNGLGIIANPFISEDVPSKPQAPSVRWLMKQLEKYDVGTGATRTSTYADVTSAKVKCPLLSEKRGKIDMTEYGQMSYGILPGTHIGDLKMTEKVMSDMRLIAEGKASPSDLLKEIRQLVKDDMSVMQANALKVRKEFGIMSKDFEKKEKYQGVWKGDTVSFTRTWGGHRFTDEECAALCRGEEIEVHGLKSAKGTTYGITGKLAQLSYNGNSYVGFERTGFASKTGVPDSWCGHDFTDEEKETLENGGTVMLDGCLSKKGNIFSCEVSYGTREDGSKGIIPNFG
jgi:DNA topoisomerase-3